MGKVPDLKRVTVEDFSKDDQPLVKKLAFIINSFHEQVRSALNKNIDFDNLDQELRVLTIPTGDNSQPLSDIVFKSGLANRVQGINVIRTIITSSNTSFPTQLPVISWSQNNTLVKIEFIGGLSPNTEYQITILTL